MKRCEHDPVYSGRTGVGGRFEFICRRCGELGYLRSYSLHDVNAEEFYQQRVAHGWATPRLPAPPAVPTRTNLPEPSPWPFVPGVIFFTCLSVACALAAIPWGPLGPLMPLWAAAMGSGLGLGTATVCYVAWKKGL